MKLKDYLANLNSLVNFNPEAMEMEVVTSCDGEANSYETIYYSPTIGFYKDGEFRTEDCYDYLEEDIPTFNAVCVN
jgi:hypothetical protein